MGDDVILTPGTATSTNCGTDSTSTEDTTQYLKKDNYLGEFSTDDEKSLARENIGVYPKSSIYTKTETDIETKTTVQQAIQLHLNTSDPHGILPVVQNELQGIVKQDGSTPFLAAQTGVDPVSDFHLTTKRFVTNLLNSHLMAEDPHHIMTLVNDVLTSYVKLSQVYLKSLLYTTSEIDVKMGDLVKRNGTVSFTRPQIGVYPTADSHLSTKQYVDEVMQNHLVDIDPHGFITTLNLRLSNYYNKSESYSKALTYSRAQIDGIILSLVYTAALLAILEHINLYDPHNTLAEVKQQGYVKKDGSVPFSATQKGVEAVEPNDLVILSLLLAVKDSLPDLQPTWVTSGTVLTTVGYVVDNTQLPDKMTFQEIMDAIFYGKVVSVTAPEYGVVNGTVLVTMNIHGSMGLVERAELYLNGVIIGTYTKDDFLNGTLTVDSQAISLNTTFEFKVYYNNGTILTGDCVTKIAYQVYVGLLPKWYTGSLITYDYLQSLVTEDPQNNSINTDGAGISNVIHSYNFTSTDLKHMFIAVPKEYPDLELLVTPSQQFGLDAFNIIDATPLHIPGINKDILYTIYIYKLALVTMNLKVTYKFKTA